MNAYDYDTMVQFVHEEDVKFIRLAFVDVFGVQKNISIMPGELERAFRDGISFDASSIEGFGDEVQSDLFLFPDPKTMSILPWRPSNGRVARMYCDIKYPDGRSFEKDSRLILKKAIAKARERQMMTVIRQRYHLMRPVIWISHRKIRARTSAVRFVLTLLIWVFARKLHIMRQDRDKMKWISDTAMR